MTQTIHATTVLGILHNGGAALGADGQATFGAMIMKQNARKVRKIADDKILTAFAGGVADAFTLMERFEDKIGQYAALKRAAIELARDWRNDRYLRRLEAMMVVMDKTEGYILSGSGDVLEPEHGVFAIGSGGMYAQAAALALKKHASHLTAEQIVAEALHIAADICIYTNHQIEVLSL